MTPKIVLLGADGDFLAALAEQLAAGQAFLPAILRNAAGTLPEAVTEEDPDIVLLDLDARGASWDGLGLCRSLRAQGVDVPMMVVSAPEDGMAAAAIEAGASTHLAKPLRLAAVLATLRDLVQTDAQRRQATLIIGPYRFQPARKWLIEAATGRTIRLTEKESAMLDLLARADGQPTARETLLEAVWGYNSGVTTHTLETHVYRLRQKIESDPANALLLITEPGGYRLG